MSSYSYPCYHPPSNSVRDAFWMDDYFGRHQYGVKFAYDDKVYTPDEVRIPSDKVFVEKEDES